MINISKYISEKLHLNKDIEVNLNTEDYFTIDITDKIDMPDWAYDFRKSSKTGKNKFWYAIYCYVYLNGPVKVNDIIKKLKPDSKAQYSYLFSALRKHDVLVSGSGKDRGLQFAGDTSKWLDFRGNSYIF